MSSSNSRYYTAPEYSSSHDESTTDADLEELVPTQEDPDACDDATAAFIPLPGEWGRLVALHRDVASHSFFYPHTEIRIGRDPNINLVVLAGNKISRQQVVILNDQGAYKLKEMSQSNHTYVCPLSSSSIVLPLKATAERNSAGV